MPPTVSRCVVFDDDAHQLETRVRQVGDVLGYLRDHEKIADGFSVRGARQRAEVLELVEENPDTLLIADLKSDRKVEAFNIGARLVRAIAENPRTSTRTRRVMWSRHNVSDVTESLRRWAHAFALYHSEGEDDLRHAILHALDERWTEAREFPAVRTPAQWSDDVRHAVAQLVDKPRPGDDRIALRLAARVDRAQINAEIERSRIEGRRPNVSALLTQITKDSNGLYDPETAEERIREVMAPFAVDRVPDPIRPADVNAARNVRRDLVERFPGDRHLAVTWLTPEEDALAAEFFSLYTQRLDPDSRGHNKHKPNEVIQGILGVDDFVPADRHWVEAMERTGLDADDLSYVIWTYIDVGRLN